MNSWQCIARHNIIDTMPFHYVYLLLLIILFSHKHRLMAIAYTIILLLFITYSITGCMSSIGAFTSIVINNWAIIIPSVIALLLVSFINFDNIYMTYLLNVLIIYILNVDGLGIKMMNYIFEKIYNVT